MWFISKDPSVSHDVMFPGSFLKASIEKPHGRATVTIFKKHREVTSIRNWTSKDVLEYDNILKKIINKKDVKINKKGE